MIGHEVTVEPKGQVVLRKLKEAASVSQYSGPAPVQLPFCPRIATRGRSASRKIIRRA